MMTTIEVQQSPGAADRLAILRPLMAFNADAIRGQGPEPVAILLRDADARRSIGGLWGMVGWGWLQIELLFVPETMRGSGLGMRLIEQAQAEALSRGCSHLWVDTFSFQASNFYLKAGFEVFGELNEYPSGNKRIFLKKSLN